MSTATSSSDRYEAARAAYDLYDREGGDSHTADVLAAALRALIEPPAVDESPAIAALASIKHIDLGDGIAPTFANFGDAIRSGWLTESAIESALTEAFRRGIQAAWESWEPENAPGVIVATMEQYAAVCEVVDAAKMDDRSEDTDVYASRILDALGVRL